MEAVGSHGHVAASEHGPAAVVGHVVGGGHPDLLTGLFEDHFLGKRQRDAVLGALVGLRLAHKEARDLVAEGIGLNDVRVLLPVADSSVDLIVGKRGAELVILEVVFKKRPPFVFRLVVFVSDDDVVEVGAGTVRVEAVAHGCELDESRALKGVAQMGYPVAGELETGVVEGLDVVGFHLGDVEVDHDFKSAPDVPDHSVGGVVPGPVVGGVDEMDVVAVGGASVEIVVVVVIVEIGLVVGGVRRETEDGLVLGGDEPYFSVAGAFRDPSLAGDPDLGVVALVVDSVAPIERKFDAAVHFRLLDAGGGLNPAKVEDPVVLVVGDLNFAFDGIVADAVDG